MQAREALPNDTAGGVRWYWPKGENPASARHAARCEGVRLLAPFDPIVWDRRRFKLLWDWTYKFEAYTPAARRQLGYYALPLLWRERVIGWANVSGGALGLKAEFGYVAGRAPREAAFRRELEAELQRLQEFLGSDLVG